MLSYFGSMLGPCWAYLGLSWRCWRYVGRMLALSWPSYCGAPFSSRKKKEPRPLGLTRKSFSIFTPRAMSSQLRCTCQLSGHGASSMPLWRPSPSTWCAWPVTLTTTLHKACDCWRPHCLAQASPSTFPRDPATTRTQPSHRATFFLFHRHGEQAQKSPLPLPYLPRVANWYLLQKTMHTVVLPQSIPLQNPKPSGHAHIP